MCRIYIIYYKQGGAGRGEWGEAIPEPAPNPSRVLKKFSKPVPNPVIKIDPRPIRGGAGRVPEKTHPIAIPSWVNYNWSNIYLRMCLKSIHFISRQLKVVRYIYSNQSSF